MSSRMHPSRALRRHLIRMAVVYAALFAAAAASLPALLRAAMRPVLALHIRLIATSLDEVVIQDLKLALLAAFVAGLPYFLFEAWTFVAPALTPAERRRGSALLLGSALCALFGASFAWWVVVPRLIRYLAAIAAWSHVLLYLRYESYVSFVGTLILAFAAAFELPIAVAWAVGMGIITPQDLKAKRRYAYFALVVVGVLLSPPELVAHLTVTVPLFLLYEGSIALATLVDRRRQKESAQSPALSER
ncbi:twin-arginine translocase subunit TatC [Alicyclobacillus vulcanalis]|uniref:Sec-independent protein translocase protein TatC n=1 Tax=Alicyclobacillus vulcanalis TaxID=252246 RepID=A0A1N7PGU5_9BACL|nr:twin-arginine translocase subunit TatC [Alicyclobacillus vulcanalis]SIT09766.1 sec-independent protein translocase protein TatC [Alicyclobacillus vulcanalis]